MKKSDGNGGNFVDFLFRSMMTMMMALSARSSDASGSLEACFFVFVFSLFVIRRRGKGDVWAKFR